MNASAVPISASLSDGDLMFTGVTASSSIHVQILRKTHCVPTKPSFYKLSIELLIATMLLNHCEQETSHSLTNLRYKSFGHWYFG